MWNNPECVRFTHPSLETTEPMLILRPKQLVILWFMIPNLFIVEELPKLILITKAPVLRSHKPDQGLQCRLRSAVFSQPNMESIHKNHKSACSMGHHKALVNPTRALSKPEQEPRRNFSNLLQTLINSA